MRNHCESKNLPRAKTGQYLRIAFFGRNENVLLHFAMSGLQTFPWLHVIGSCVLLCILVYVELNNWNKSYRDSISAKVFATKHRDQSSVIRIHRVKRENHFPHTVL